jgi:4-hydroxy-tetrahydrodipicolinate synthase
MKKFSHLDPFPLWTAIVTPFHKNGELDLESFKRLLKTQAEANVAVLLLGSTGESLALNLSEKKQVIATALEEKRIQHYQIPYMVGVGGISLPEQKEWVEYLNTLALDAYLLVTPLYAKPGRVGQREWFSALMDTANKPCMLYNVPSRTGIKMNFDAVKDLSHHKNFWAIKEASGSVEDFKKYLSAAPQVQVFSGDDGLTFDFCQVGGIGLVSVAANVWPKETLSYVKLCLKGKSSASAVKDWPRFSDALFIASNPVPVKALLKEKKIIDNDFLRAPLSIADLPSRAPLIETDQEVLAWFKQNK